MERGLEKAMLRFCPHCKRNVKREIASSDAFFGCIGPNKEESHSPYLVSAKFIPSEERVPVVGNWMGY